MSKIIIHNNSKLSDADCLARVGRYINEYKRHPEYDKVGLSPASGWDDDLDITAYRRHENTMTWHIEDI